MMKYLMLETQNTISGKNDDIFKRFALFETQKEKRRLLKHFRQPTITTDIVLLSYAVYLDSYVDCNKIQGKA